MKSVIFCCLCLLVVSPNAQTIKAYIDNNWPDNRYTISGDGTVTDRVTGLMWQQCPQGLSGSDCAVGSATSHTWQEALQLVVSDNTAGHTDWRLPNVKELRSVAAYDRSGPSINTVVFPNTGSSSYSSSSPASGQNSWAYNFNHGFSGSPTSRGQSARVRLVRGGNLHWWQ